MFLMFSTILLSAWSSIFPWVLKFCQNEKGFNYIEVLCLSSIIFGELTDSRSSFFPGERGKWCCTPFGLWTPSSDIMMRSLEFCYSHTSYSALSLTSFSKCVSGVVYLACFVLLLISKSSSVKLVHYITMIIMIQYTRFPLYCLSHITLIKLIMSWYF